MSRKVFISFLGTGCYKKCMYRYPDGTKSNSVSFVQEATLDYLTKKEEWPEDSVAYILLTDEAEEKNWNDGYEFELDDGSTYEQDYGLDTKLQKLKTKKKLALSIEPIPVDKETVSDFWSLFMLVLDKIKNGDELYLDVTHGYRYLPMFLLVFCNYTKFLKQVKVRHISYGNWEALDKGTNVAPIVDLLPLSELQDWTFAAGQYLETGNVDRLVDLSNSELRPILKEAKGTNEEATNLRVFVLALSNVIKERQTCRGLSIINSENLKILKEKADNLSEDSLIKPLNPVIDKIKDSFAEFDANENIKNGFASAKWCFQNKLFQQSATILQEVVVSFFCSRHGIAIDDEERREIINQALILKVYHQDTDEGNNWARVKTENKETLAEVFTDELLTDEVATIFQNLSEVRNDYNHSGMRSKRLPMKPDAIIKNIEKCLNDFKTLFV